MTWITLNFCRIEPHSTSANR